MARRVSTLRRAVLNAPLALLAASPATHAQTASFPSRPLRIVVGFPPGNTLDVVTRIVAEALRKKLGQPIVVERTSPARTARSRPPTSCARRPTVTRCSRRTPAG